MNLRVVEQYTSFQGTGTLSGTQQHFVRLAGCHVSCPIRRVCDEPQALSPEAGKLMSVDDVLRGVGDAPWIHVSGGEPLEQREGIVAMSRRRKVQIQTSGTLELPVIRGIFVTCSPKAPPEYLALTSCDELVVVAAPWVKPEYLEGWARRFPRAARWIVPLWGESADTAVRLISVAKQDWRLAIQAHKHWGLK